MGGRARALVAISRDLVSLLLPCRSRRRRPTTRVVRPCSASLRFFWSASGLRHRHHAGARAPLLRRVMVLTCHATLDVVTSERRASERTKERTLPSFFARFLNRRRGSFSETIFDLTFHFLQLLPYLTSPDQLTAAAAAAAACCPASSHCATVLHTSSLPDGISFHDS